MASVSMTRASLLRPWSSDIRGSLPRIAELPAHILERRAAMRRALLLLGALAACGTDELEQGNYVSYDLHAHGILFDRLHVQVTREPRERPAPLTPSMIANGLGAPSSWEVRDEWFFGDYVMEPRMYYRFEYHHPIAQFYGLVVVAFYGPDLVAAGVASLTPVNYGDHHKEARGSLELEAASVELWGVERSDDGPRWGPCTRIRGAVVQYVVREIDTDCDAIYDQYDCQPSAYCPPDEPSAPTCACP